MTLTAIFESSQRLALVASEEAIRLGHPEVDVEHVFLALTVSQTEAGRRLRAAGVDLFSARAAVQAEHDARLEPLGLGQLAVPVGRIPDGGPQSIDYNERTRGLVSRSGDSGDGLRLLQDLIDEPSGRVEATLRRLAVATDIAATDTTAPDSPRSAAVPAAEPSPATATTGHIVLDSFVPAPPAQVWALLNDVERRPEWDNALVSIEPIGSDTWVGHHPNHPITGKPLPARQASRTIILTGRDEDRPFLEWDVTHRSRFRSTTQRIRVELAEEEPGGTTLRWSLHLPDRRRIGRLVRFAAAGELSRLAAGVSRAFRV